MQSVHKFGKRALTMAVAAAIHPAVVHAESAAHIDFAIGNVSATAANGAARNLKKGMEVNPGDTVVTANNARAQMRFSDGGYISLQPNTRFRIDDYRFGGVADGKEKGFFSLVKGGLRAITGAIGKGNRANYQLQTPVATIGIRGTHYRARLCENDCKVLDRVMRDGLYVSVGEGGISLNNAAGKTDLDQGGTAFVADKNSAPTRVEPPPVQLPRIESDSKYMAGEGRNERGEPAVLFGFTRTLDPAFGAFAIDGATARAFDLATVDDAGQMFSFREVTNSTEVFRGSTVIMDSGTNGLISWGRWTGGLTTPNSLGVSYNLTGGSSSLHYVVTDAPTPSSVFTTGSTTLTYAFSRGTAATSNTGGGGLGITGGSLTLNLSTSSTLSGNFTVDFGGQNHNVSLATTIITSAVFNASASTSGGICGVSGCSTTVKGVFAGANAESAGLTYQFQDPIGPTIVSGAGVFNR